MRSRAVLFLLMGVALVAVGVWLGWVVVIVVVIGISSVFAIRYFLRAPKSGTWWDLTSPVRVTRGDHADLSIAVSLSPGSPRWVSAVDGAVQVDQPPGSHLLAETQQGLPCCHRG